MAKRDYECTFDLQDCIKTFGLDEGGRVQQYITEEFKKNVQAYVPFDEAGIYENSGRLKDGGHSESGKKKHEHMADISGVENDTDVVWKTPYARNLYYHPQYNFQGAPTRGGYWASRYLQNGGSKELEAGARKIVKKMGK